MSSVCGLQWPGWNIGRSQGRALASFAREDCGKSLGTMRALVHRFLSHSGEHGEQGPGASRWETRLCEFSC